jgi:hypothetical protein
MCHPTQQAFVGHVRGLLPQCFKRKKVLEVGSLDINGSVRVWFEECDYLGIDLGPGPGVDQVAHVCDVPWAPRVYDTVISCEALEHDSRWAYSVQRMYELVRPGGLLLVTCAGIARGRHGTHDAAPECSPYTKDYYRGLSRQDLEQYLPVPAHWRCSAVDTQFFCLRAMP